MRDWIFLPPWGTSLNLWFHVIVTFGRKAEHSVHLFCPDEIRWHQIYLNRFMSVIRSISVEEPKLFMAFKISTYTCVFPIPSDWLNLPGIIRPTSLFSLIWYYKRRHTMSLLWYTWHHANIHSPSHHALWLTLTYSKGGLTLPSYIPSPGMLA